MYLTDTGTAAFGKLPWAGDFVRAGETGGVSSLLSWMEQGVGIASHRDNWKAEFERAAQKAFIMPQASGLLISGVMAPSHDEVGRRFPFSIFGPVDLEQASSAPHVLPLVLGSFLQGAGETIVQLQASAGGASALGSVTALSAPRLDSIDAHVESYGAWIQSAPLRALGQAVFGVDWRRALAHALYVCLESVRPFYGQESPPTPLAVRLPIGTGYAGAASFWLHVIRLAAGWKSTIPAAFWSFESGAASMTVCLGQMGPSAFADLWSIQPDSDVLSDLTNGEPSLAEHLESIAPRVQELVVSNDCSVADLITAVQSSRY